MTALADSEGRIARSDDLDLDLDSIAAVIHTADRRYLLQHREDRAGVSYPGMWSLFGGGREIGEDALAALRREMMEELEFPIRKWTVFLGCTYDLVFEARRARKIFFSVEMTDGEAERLVLHEGQGMKWFHFIEILACGASIVPYDLGVIALHHARTFRSIHMSAAG